MNSRLSSVSVSALLAVLAAVISGCAAPLRIAYPPEQQAKTVTLGTGQAVLTWTVPDEDEKYDEIYKQPSLGGSGDGTTYLGSSRKAAKLSISSASVKKFNGVCEFLAALPSDDDMRKLGIGKGADSGRVSQEDFNATFVAYVLASSYPADNDFHVIIGDDGANPKCLLNVEVSGLPSDIKAPGYSTLQEARKTYINCMGSGLPKGGYSLYKPGIKMTFLGSGFFDVAHGSGTIGPAGFKPATSWELHPVTGVDCR